MLCVIIIFVSGGDVYEGLFLNFFIRVYNCCFNRILMEGGNAMQYTNLKRFRKKKYCDSDCQSSEQFTVCIG